MRKIDIHCHTTLSALRETVPSSARIEEIEKNMKLHDIEATVVLASYYPAHGKGISNFRLLHWIREKPRFLLFGSLDFQYFFPSGYKELVELAEGRYLRGIKIYSGYQKIDFCSEKVSKVLELAEAHRLPVMFHGGFIQGKETDLDFAFSPGHLSTLLDRFPEVSFVVSHLAWPHVDLLIELVKKHPNLQADMSGMLDSFKTPSTFSDCAAGIRKYLDACGPKRLLFGTDFPIQTHEHSVRLVEEAMTGFSDREKRSVYYENAKSILGGC